MEWISEQYKHDPSVDIKISSVFRKYTEVIANSGLTRGLTIVTGPFGIGKSTYLIPDIRDTVRSTGKQSIPVDCQEYGSSSGLSYMFNKVGRVNEGVVIMDESSVITQAGSELTSETLATFQRNGWNVVAFISYPIQYPYAMRESVEVWSEAAKNLGMFRANRIDIPSIRFSKDLAVSFLLSTLAYEMRQETINIPKQNMDFVLETAPYNLATLVLCTHFLRWERTTELLAKAIRTNLSRLAYFLTKSEIEKIENKISRVLD